MYPRIAFSGTNGGVCFSALGFDRALAEIGLNTGNALFQFALWDRIVNPKMAISPGSYCNYVRDAADVLLFPAANQVNPAWDLGRWADFVEFVNLPCIMIGLGAQASLDGSDKLELKEGTLRFLQSVAKRTTRIGVRGDYTRRVLLNLGIENTAVTGCPSQLINKRVSGAEIARQLKELSSNRTPRIGYVFGTMERETLEAEARLSSLVSRFSHAVIFQTEKRILEFLFDGTLSEDGRNLFAWIGKKVRPDLNEQEYRDYLSRHGCFFSDARTWIDRMRQFDVVLGMRIHGAVAAIQAGRLGICVAFDSRTLELARTMGYPYILARDVPEKADFPSLLERVVFDADAFEDLRSTHAGTIDGILTEGGCAVNANR